MDWLKIALNGLQIGSILATAGFAAFGLVSKFKDDAGKLTKAGRIALVGIGLSALLSLGTQTAKAEADRQSAARADKAHRADLDAELERYRTQSKALGELDSKQRRALQETQRIQGQAKQTLDALRIVQDRVDQSVRAVGLVGQKQDLHTARMLRTMWNDANRIDGNSIELLMQNYCLASGSEEIPRILPAGATALIRVAPKDSLKLSAVPPDSFRTDLLLPDDAVTFSSRDQRVEVSTFRTVDTTEFKQFTRFGPFQIDRIGPFSAPDTWRNAVVEILITGEQPGLAKAVEQAAQGLIQDENALRHRYHISHEILSNDDYSMAGLPCSTTLYLMVNGRQLAVLEVNVVQVWEHDEDVRGLVVVKSHVSPVDSGALPQFSGLR